ncbi:YetF domain-containing protein [Tersicoccus sp. MR15.9]|uniref:DUF421 domain-containing protein n=1 Tax=Tersicoccus mangrovi TaxID=3121635 RepID=UPI002FE5C4C2
MWDRLGTDGAGVIAVMIAAAGIYVVFLVIVRLFGQRPLARMATADVVVVLALGPIAGRAVLGTSVTLTAGAVALLTLFVLRLIVQRISRNGWGRHLVRTEPLVLMAGGRVQHDLLARARVSEGELYGALRGSGIRDCREVACVVLEPTGSVSVIRTGMPLDRVMFADLVGGERMPRDLFAD